MKKTIIILLAIFLFMPTISLATCDPAKPSLKCAFSTATGHNLQGAGDGAGYTTGTPAETQTAQMISAVITTVLSFLGVIFLILMIYGGFLRMTAAGNDDQIKKSNELMKSAVIGLIIVVSAYAISMLIMSKVSPTFIK